MTDQELFDTAIAIFRYQGINMTDFDTLAQYLQMPVGELYDKVANSKEVLVLSTIKFEIEREYRYVNELSTSISPLRFISKLYVHAMRFFNSFHPSFFKDLRSYPMASHEFECYIAHLRGKFNEALQSCISRGLCIKEFDSFMFSSFLCIRIKEIKDGIICQKEKISGMSQFLINTLLMGCCTDAGKMEMKKIYRC